MTGQDDPTDPTPEFIDGRYEVVRKLGAGGFGHVLLVKDGMHRGKLVALKVLRPATGEGEGFEERFLHEIEILRSLQHPGIPPIFNDGRATDGSFYFTMEYVEGPTLAHVLREHDRDGTLMAPERMVKTLHRVLEILDYAHARGVVHRDLKPGNIMLVRAGQPTEDVRVLDFGIAKVLRGGASGLDLPSLTLTPGIGTPHYMAPEQLRGKDVDARADLYAIGVILYQMCAGSYPFNGDSDLEIATARLVEDPKPIDDATTPLSLRKLVLDLLERDRERRPSSADVRRRLLEADLSQRKIETEAFREESPEERAPLAVTAPRESRPNVRWFALGAVLGVLVLAGAGWMIFRPKAPADSGAVTHATNAIPAAATELDSRPSEAPGSATAESKAPESKPPASNTPPPNTPAFDLPWAELIEFDPNPSVIADADLRARIVATNLPWHVSDKLSKIELYLVPPGTYKRGAGANDSDADDNERPVHAVTLTRPFYLGRTEVTAAEWGSVMGIPTPVDEIGFPKVDVTDGDIQAFFAKLKGEHAGCLRLPTEAEWEYACRAGTPGARYGDLDQIAVFGGNSRQHVAKVATKRANAFGFHDMLGNVWEICADKYSPLAYRACAAGATDPLAASASGDHVRRGGAWSVPKSRVRASARDVVRANLRSNSLGFRVARSP